MIDYDEIFQEFKDGEIYLLYSNLYLGLIIFASDLLGEELSFLSEDCVQEAIIDSYLKRDRFENADKWRNYILTVIRNRALDTHRKYNSRLNYFRRDEFDFTDDDISVAMISQETYDMLYNAIESLPDRYREIFDLSFEQGLKNAEVAARIGLSEIGVKKRKTRLIELLRIKLGLKSADEVLLIIASAHLSILISN